MGRILSNIGAMAGDLMWGGVPRILPSDTCLKYQNDVKTKVLKEKDLPTGSHLRATRILEGIRGFKQCKKDISESYDNYYRTLKRMPRDPMKQMVNPENKRRPCCNSKETEDQELGWDGQS